MTPEYERLVRFVALGVAGRGKIGDRETKAIERAIVLKGGIVDGDLCSASEFKVVIGDVLTEVTQLFSEILPRIRQEFSGELAGEIETVLNDKVRTIAADIEDAFGTKH
jgi:hypothetical protein